MSPKNLIFTLVLLSFNFTFSSVKDLTVEFKNDLGIQIILEAIEIAEIEVRVQILDDVTTDGINLVIQQLSWNPRRIIPYMV